MSTLALGQSDQPTPAQPSVQPPAIQQPAKEARSALDNAARASRQLQQSAPPAKVYGDQDLRGPEDAGDGAAGDHSTATAAPTRPATFQTASHPVTRTAGDPLLQKVKAFEAQGKIFQNQVRVEKNKIAGIQNHLNSLKRQFANWRAGFARENEAFSCWTSLYSVYQDYCDTGRNLKAQYEAAQSQLAQEKARLEQMQENIRRKGYGNAVYDAD